MSRDWKPGDVALVNSWRGEGQIAFRCERVEGQPTWCVLDGTDSRGLSDNEVTEARPVAVIDPENRGEVYRFTLAHNAQYSASRAESVEVTRMQNALREFAAPTPTGCEETLTIGNLRIECERDRGHVTDHRNDSIGQGVRWGA